MLRLSVFLSLFVAIQAQSCADVIASNFPILSGLINDAGITLPAEVTVFAPEDAAFTTEVVALYSNLSATEQAGVLAGHVLDSSVSATDAIGLNNARVTTVGTTPIWVTTNSTNVWINDAMVVNPIQCDEGWVHGINQVLLPLTADIATTAASTGVHDTLVALLTQQNLTGALVADGNFTVFAPVDEAFGLILGAGPLTTDAAFSDLLTNILTFHVVDGVAPSWSLTSPMSIPTLSGSNLQLTIDSDGVFPNNRQAIVITANVFTTNGVIHIIGPALTVSPPAVPGVLVPDVQIPDVLVLVNTTAIRGAFVGDVTVEADLTSTTMDYTVFAPIDSAVADFVAGNGTVDTELLQAHYLSGLVPSSALANDLVVNTVAGTSFRVNVYGNGAITFNGVPVYTVLGAPIVDAGASNGIVHVVQDVLPVVNADIATLGTNAGVFQTLLSLVDAVNLTSAFTSAGNLTVFAPTDDAFNALFAACPGIDTWLAANPDNLTDVLLYHVIGSTVYSAGVVDGDATTLSGSDVTLAAATMSTPVMVNMVPVMDGDISATNGVIHIIGEVLVPPTLDTSMICGAPPSIYEQLVAQQATGLLSLVDMDDTVRAILNGTAGPNVTLFAPTNEAITAFAANTDAYNAFAADLTQSLLYHATGGFVMSSALSNNLLVTMATTDMDEMRVNVYGNGAVTFNGIRANTSRLDIPASNGVIHFINGVLERPVGSVVDAAIGTPALSNLTSLVIAAGLVEALNGTGNLTVFAPTDTAFADLEAACPGVTAALGANTTLLGEVLSYHVLTDTVYSAGLVDMAMPATLEGETITVDLTSGVMIVSPLQAANVVIPDIPVTNGVVHVIDAVLVPQFVVDILPSICPADNPSVGTSPPMNSMATANTMTGGMDSGAATGGAASGGAASGGAASGGSGSDSDGASSTLAVSAALLLAAF